MTNFEIAKALDVSPRSVRRYKDYNGLVRSSPEASLMSSPMTRPPGQALDSTDRTRPDASHDDEEPKGIKFVGGKKKHKEPKPVEEKEYEYECPHCHHEFNERSENCPSCGWSLSGYDDYDPDPEEFEYECPHCHHEFNERSENCPSCGWSLSGYDD